ncbi:ATP-binding protein, partial [Candidatus Poribacteria bacterium]|nr:ATP-binding protein [Candidatus Poribacteria bacterium]
MFTKPIDKITFEDVENFCHEFGEGVRVEYKREIAHIPKIVSSFANTLGGIFIIGVETDEMNKVVSPIKGMPKETGIEERILQSALTGIYPAVMPEVIIRAVPNSNNVVVIIRVDESIQAPHAIEKSTKIYFRSGSITQPYKLADTERIAYMFKRREDSQVIAKQILNRIEERTETLCATDNPNLTVIIRPVFPYQSVISTVDIHEVARAELAPHIA